MGSKDKIEHKGTILDIDGKMISVAVAAESACGSCKVKGMCGMSESEEKVVIVHSDIARIFEVGEEVNVSISKIMGMKAIWWSYVCPLILMLLSLFILGDFGLSEAATGLITLGIAAVYFFVLYLMRDKLEREIIFKIDKI